MSTSNTKTTRGRVQEPAVAQPLPMFEEVVAATAAPGAGKPVDVYAEMQKTVTFRCGMCGRPQTSPPDHRPVPMPDSKVEVCGACWNIYKGPDWELDWQGIPVLVKKRHSVSPRVVPSPGAQPDPDGKGIGRR